jgi:Skp family chaperone for outer membrane proteins
MNRFFLGAAAAAAALAVPMVAQAQNLPPAVVAVVDRERIIQQCTACVAASQQLEAQQLQLQQRAQQLGIARSQANQPTPLEVEQQAIQAAVNALPPGQQADPALQTRFEALQTRAQNAEREINGREDQIRRNRLFILQQIDQRLNPIIVQVMQQRGANMAVGRESTLAIAPSLDITDAVLAALNQQMTSLNVNAPPAPQQPAQQPAPQGR